MKTAFLVIIALTFFGCGNQEQWKPALQGTPAASEVLRPADADYPLSAAKLEELKAKALPEGEASSTSRGVAGGLYILVKALVYRQNCSLKTMIYGVNFQTAYFSYSAAMDWAVAISRNFYEALRLQYGNCPASIRPNELYWAQVSNKPGESPGGGYLKAFNGNHTKVAEYYF